MVTDLIDAYLRRSFSLIKAADGEASESLRMAKASTAKINAIVEDLFDGPLNKRRITESRVAINNIIQQSYSVEIRKKVSQDIDDVLQLEIEWNINKFKKLGFGNVVVSPDAVIVTKEFLKNPYQGKTFDQWFRAEGVVQAKTINRIITSGIISGTPTDKIISAISKATTLSEHHVKTLTRSAVLGSANYAKDEFFKANDDLIDFKEWVSTLDVRTTAFICGPRDGLRYDANDEPVGHSMPWDAGPGMIHFNCRSTFVPIMKGVSVIAPRPAVGPGKNYEKGDKTTRTGKPRKPTKANRDKEILKVTQVTNKTNYENWLRRQPKKFISDAFGANKSAVDSFKSGASLSTIAKDLYGPSTRISDLTP